MTTETNPLEIVLYELLKAVSTDCVEDHQLHEPVVPLDVVVKALLPMLESQRRIGQIEGCVPSEAIKFFIRSHDPQLHRVYGTRFYTVGIDKAEWDAMFPGVESPGLSFVTCQERFIPSGVERIEEAHNG